MWGNSRMDTFMIRKDTQKISDSSIKEDFKMATNKDRAA